MPSDAGAGAGAQSNKPIKAKLGEANSFYYDPELKRWVNKNAGPEESSTTGRSTPPPPRSTSRGPSRGPSLRSTMSTPPPAMSDSGPTSAPPHAPPSGPPMGPPSRVGTPVGGGAMLPPSLASLRSTSNVSAGVTPASRPGTAMSTSSDIDDLLAVAPKKSGDKKKGRKSGRYIDVMAKS
jgi:hypothetical protein